MALTYFGRASRAIPILFSAGVLLGSCTDVGDQVVDPGVGAEESTAGLVDLGEPSVLSVPDCDDDMRVEKA